MRHSLVAGHGIVRPRRTPHGNVERPRVTRTTRDTVRSAPGVVAGGSAFCRMLVRVKSSHKMLAAFLRYCTERTLKAVPENPDRHTITLPGGEVRTRLTHRDWWVVTGLPHQFDRMRVELTGDRLPVLEIKPVDNVRVGVVACGSGPMTEAVKRKLRTLVPDRAPVETEVGKRFREWREQAAAARARPHSAGEMRRPTSSGTTCHLFPGGDRRPDGVGRPRTCELREVVNAILYPARGGCTWRMLPHDFPPEEMVFYYFYTRRGVMRFRTLLTLGAALLLIAR